MIENNKYFIDQINSSKANKMTALYHYSKTGFKKAILNLGVFRKEDNLLVGVLQWGRSFQENIRLDRYVKEPIKKEEYFELNRFSMAESEGKNSESQAISLGIRWIKKYRPEIKLLVSYAGRREGHFGYIYQATNWEYLGYFISPGFWIVDGHEKHMMTLWCNYSLHDKGQKSFYESLCDEYQDVRQTWTKQFIYIKRLNKKLTPASPVLPYPKPSTDAPIKIKEKILKENNEVFNHPQDLQIPFVKFYYEKDEFLFSKATLIRRGELKKEKKIILQYDKFGELKEKYFSVKDASEKLHFPEGGIRNALKTQKIYKDNYFRYGSNLNEPDENIEISCLAYIDEIPFSTYTEMAKYLNVSKQAVQQAAVRKSKKIKNKDVFWIN